MAVTNEAKGMLSETNLDILGESIMYAALLEHLW